MTNSNGEYGLVDRFRLQRKIFKEIRATYRPRKSMNASEVMAK
jgi:hypothetical protein